MTNKLATTAALLALSLSGVARADEPPAAPALEAAPAPEPLRSPQLATALSLAGALVPAGMLALGNTSGPDTLVPAGMALSLVTPTLGHFYAGHYLTWGMALRAAGVASATAGFVSGFCFGHASCGDADDAAFALGVGLGAAAYLAGTVYDVATAGRAAERYNQRHAARLQLGPTMVPSGTGHAVGLGLSGAF